MKELLTIEPVTIYHALDGRYVQFISDLSICNDGTGPDHGDPYHQSETAYYNAGDFLNADEDRYVVVPPQIRSSVPPIVMGCQARVTNLKTGEWSWGVVGDIGPQDKTGETAYCLAKVLNPSITHNAGDDELIYLYEIFPGRAAVVEGRKYTLEPAG